MANPLETATTAAHMVVAGVMERHPELRVLLAHGGGALLAVRGRMRHAHGFQPQARSRLRESPEDSIRRFYFDTLTHDDALLRALIDYVGPSTCCSAPTIRSTWATRGRWTPCERSSWTRRSRRRSSPATPSASRARAGAERRHDMTQTADVVVAGAGHNSLITAAYLAKAGYECLVLDARPIPGGGAATEELLGPGYRIDSCSTGHTIIRVNPLLDERRARPARRLRARVLRARPGRPRGVPGRRAAHDVARPRPTCDEIARFSSRDAEAYRRLIAEYDEVKGIFGRARVTPPGFGPSLEEMLLEHPRGRIWLRRNAITAWDVIRREFEDRHVQAFMIWQAFQTLVPVDAAGSGVNAYSIIFGRQGRSWSVPRGGSGALTDALTRFLEDHGSTVICNRQVSRLVLEDGRCTGVETDDGERYMARRAVLSTIHVKHLVEMAPREAWGEEFVYGVDTYDVGMSGHGVLPRNRRRPEFETPDGPARPSRRARSAGRRRCSRSGGRCATAAPTTRACRGCSWPRRRWWTRTARRRAITRSSC